MTDTSTFVASSDLHCGIIPVLRVATSLLLTSVTLVG
jgi:hypothetical protein